MPVNKLIFNFVFRFVQYCIVRNIEENKLQIFPKDLLRPYQHQDLYTVKPDNGKEYHAILIHTGGNSTMFKYFTRKQN